MTTQPNATKTEATFRQSCGVRCDVHAAFLAFAQDLKRAAEGGAP